MHSKKMFTHETSEDGSERRLRERKNTVFSKKFEKHEMQEAKEEAVRQIS